MSTNSNLKNRIKNQNKGLGNKGFTLMEMIVTLAVMAIALTLTGLGMLTYQDWTDFNKENEYAQTIFIAAQNQLSEYNANGRLKELQKDLADGEGDFGTSSAIGYNLSKAISANSILDGEGNPYKIDKIWPQSVKESDPDKYRDTIISLRTQAGDYQEYLSNPDSYKASNPEQFWVFEMVGAYIYDSSILRDAALCIEFTPEDGQVFAVLYSDKNTAFEYDINNNNTRGLVNITNREEAYRQERMIGHYGVDTLSKATLMSESENLLQIKLNKAMLFNEERTRLEFVVDKESIADNQSLVGGSKSPFTYMIDVYDKESNKKKLTLALPGSMLAEPGSESVNSVITADVKSYIYDDSDNQLDFNDGDDIPVQVYRSDAYTINVMLDSADIQAQTSLYSWALDGSTGAQKKFNNTYSYFRFGLGTDDIYCTVMATADGYMDSEEVTSNSENPVFRLKRELAAGSYEYNLDNSRHLYNVRYVEDITKEQESLIAKETIADTYFNVHSNIDWEAFQKAGYVYDSFSHAAFVDLSSKSLTRINCDFPSIRTIRANDSLYTSLESATIAGLNMSNASNSLYGFYSTSSGGAGGDKLADGVEPTAFINVNYGSVSKLKLDKFSVDGSFLSKSMSGTYTGGFIGLNAGEAIKLETLNTGGNSVVKGISNVGGIIGFQIPNASDVTITNLTNRASVVGEKAVGGVLGMVRNEFGATTIDLSKLGLDPATIYAIASNTPTITIDSCYNYGPVGANTDKAPDESMFIGGIVGYSYNKNKTKTELIKIENCISSPQYTDVTDNLKDINAINSSNKLKGVYVGGIAGYNHYGEINSCEGKAENGKQGYIFGYEYVGGIVGLNEGPASGITGGSVKQGINENNVIGYKYVGGITGCNAAPSGQYQDNSKAEVDPVLIDGIIKPAQGRGLNVRVKNWVNKGVVVATDSYGGGITGFNTGWIYNCNTIIDASKANAVFGNLFAGSYIGGVAGYNNGIIGNTVRNDEDPSKVTGASKKIVITGYTRGINYVGGVAGYNDVDSIIEDYQISGGFVMGPEDSCYVGGYVGLNASTNLLMDEKNNPRSVNSNPDKVQGGYFVGGVIGGNIINTNGRSTKPAAGVNDAYSAADKENDDLVYAYFTGPVGTPDNKNSYYTINNLVLYNNTGKTVSSWSVPLNMGKYELLNNWGGQTRMYNGTLYWNTAWNSNIPAGGSTQWITIASTNEDEIRLLEGKKLKVYYFDASDNSVGNYKGSYTGVNEACKVTFEERKGNEYNFYNQYQLYITNTSDVILPNYRCEIQLPEGASLTSWMKWEHDGNLWYLYSDQVDNAFLEVGAKKEIYLQINFTSEDMMNKFVFDPKVYFNNVYYADVNGGSTGNGDGGNSNAEQPSGSRGTGTPEKGDIIASFSTDNFNGSLTGKAFVGGFLGYTQLIDSADSSTVETLAGQIVKDIKSGDLVDKVDYLADVKTSTGVAYGESYSVLYVTGAAGKSKSNLNAISGDIYVGGVIGFNEEETDLYIKDVENATPVTARTAIEYADEQIVTVSENGVAVSVNRVTDYADRPFTYNYSYTGGVIGKVTKRVTVDNCRNVSLANVTTYGTYTGGLCEINEGLVKNCNVNTMGNSSVDYLGGLCGLNKEGGRIENCNFENQTITGRNVVGGIVAENFGSLSGNKLNGAAVFASPSVSNDGVAGALAGYNGFAGVISLSENVAGAKVESRGNYAGIITGYNQGNINNINAIGMTDTSKNITIAGSVKANMYAGALAGCNNGLDSTKLVDYFTNTATVDTVNGGSGGIIGYNMGLNTIQYCENKGVVTAIEQGDAGGITSTNRGVITKCYDYVSVFSPNGNCGGIVALNEGGVITDCTVEGLDGGKVILTSKYRVGGIAAKNVGQEGLEENITSISFNGLIENNHIKNLEVSNETGVKGTSIGLIAGDNMLGGKIVLAGDTDSSQGIADSKAIANTSECLVGGIAGTNQGQIIGKKDSAGNPASFVNCQLELNSDYASMGGVAGLNTGLIENVAVVSIIDCKSGAEKFGYGGIAGYSGYKEKTDKIVSINNCTFDGKINATGASGEIVRIGGITGINGYGSTIDKCYIGANDIAVAGDGKVTDITVGKANASADTSAATYQYSTAVAYMGGYAGENYGIIKPCDNKLHSIDTVNIIGGNGYSGGFVGHNYSSGVVTGDEKTYLSTGDKWTLVLRTPQNDMTVGGIIGRSLSAHPMKYIKNYATIRTEADTNNKAAGIIGMLEQNDKLYVDFYDVTNYGNVNAGCAGGFIATLRISNAIFRDCINWGHIAASGAVATQGSGFVAAQSFQIKSLEFYNCENHGNISTNHAKGGSAVDAATGAFLGVSKDRKGDTKTGYFYNCVNTGIIYNTMEYDKNVDKRFGIGSFVGTPTVDNEYTFMFCRNYNTNTETVRSFTSVKKSKIYSSFDMSGLRGDATSELRRLPFGSNGTGNANANNETDIKSPSFFIDKHSADATGEPYKLDAAVDSGERLYVSGNNVFRNDGSTKLFEMKFNDPLSDTYYEDISKTNYADKSKINGKTIEDSNHEEYKAVVKGLNSRWDMYLEMDPKVKDMLMSNAATVTGAKLRAPVSSNNVYENGCVTYKWTKVTKDINGANATPITYMVYYQVKTVSGNVIESNQVEVGADKDNYSVPVDNEWVENGYILTCQVQAIHSYHYSQNRTDLDSDMTEMAPVIINKKALPTPKIHIEIVDEAGDGTGGGVATIVLDNYNEFVEITGESAPDVDIYYYWKKTSIDKATTLPTYQWNLKDGPVYPQYIIMDSSGGSNDNYSVRALPGDSLKDRFTNSVISSTIFRGYGNGTAGNKLAAVKSITTVFYRGFAGNDVNDMTYRVTYSGSGISTTVITDLVAYDEEMKASVAVANVKTNLQFSEAKSTSEVSLPAVPSKWFSEEGPERIEVRSYPYICQNDFIHYGHYVTDADGNDIEITDNDGLKAVKDKDYFKPGVKDGTVSRQEDKLVYDSSKSEMTPGYVLMDQQNGKYKIYYSAVLALSMKDAAATRGTIGVDSEYYRYGVSYCIYEKMGADGTRLPSISVNKTDFATGYYRKGMQDNNGSFNEGNWNREEYDNSLRNVQESGRTPSINKAELNSEGKYVIEWDSYYYPAKTPTTFVDGIDSWTKFYDAAKVTTSGAKISDIYNKYKDNYDNANYKLEIVGLSADGDETVLKTEYVNTASIVDNKVGYSIKTYSSEIDVDSSWETTYLGGIYARVVRLGVDNSSQIGGLTISKRLPAYAMVHMAKGKQKLATIGTPEVNNIVDSPVLEYEIKWDKSVITSEMLPDLAGYVITVSENSADNPTVRYFYRTISGQTIDMSAIPADSVSSNIPDENYVEIGDNCTATINLAAFSGKNVNLTVRAVAKVDSDLYVHGDESPAKTFDVIAKLPVPDASKFTVSDNGMPEYASASDNAVSIEDYGEFDIYYSDDSSYVDYNGISIEIAAAIFDSADSAEDKSSLEASEWIDGAVATLNSKDSPVELTDQGSDLSTVFANTIVDIIGAEELQSGQYAGKWVKIVFRAKDSNDKYSLWSDEDPDGNTSNYVWIHIPKLKVDDPELTAGIGTIYYDGSESVFEAPDPADPEDIKLTVRTVTFKLDEHADSYTVKFTDSSSIVSELTFTRQYNSGKTNADSDYYYWDISGCGVQGMTDSSYVKVENTVAGDKTYKLDGLKKTVSIDPNNDGSSLDMDLNAYMTYDKASKEITIYLQDVNKWEYMEDSTKSGKGTYQINKVELTKEYNTDEYLIDDNKASVNLTPPAMMAAARRKAPVIEIDPVEVDLDIEYLDKPDSDDDSLSNNKADGDDSDSDDADTDTDGDTDGDGSGKDNSGDGSDDESDADVPDGLPPERDDDSDSDGDGE